ncbi:MAG: tRNA lysidine(34) synthetase TilS [Verrucomicrobiota bacterium]|jgi:tRNA(Ile)-lysidine synthase
MSDLTGHIETSIRDQRLFRDGQRILAAVSGGVDSMVLLELLHRLSKIHRWKLTVAHFNHQLRGAASDADERLVRKTARKLRLPLVAGRGNVQELARESGVSVEMAARKLRHDFFAATAAKLRIPTVALAHHADDQVELFFLRLLRGTGGGGLAGMKWSNPSPSAPKIRLARPLLDLPKDALQSFAKVNKLVFSEDASNASIDILRNRVRRELIPLLTRHYQPALTRTVLRLMDVVGADADFVALTAGEWIKGGRTPDFDHLPVAAQRQIIHLQLRQARLSPDYDLIEHLRLRADQWMAVSADCSVSRDASGMVHRRRQASIPFSSSQRKLSLTGRKGAPVFDGLKVHWEIVDDRGMIAAGKQANVEHFDADKVGAPIWLRHWRPGDRFQPIGTASPRKLQDLFTNLKVPPAERRGRVVAATRQGKIFWVEGLRMAEEFKLDKSTTRKLKWSWRRPPSAEGYIHTAKSGFAHSLTPRSGERVRERGSFHPKVAESRCVPAELPGAEAVAICARHDTLT